MVAAIKHFQTVFGGLDKSELSCWSMVGGKVCVLLLSCRMCRSALLSARMPANRRNGRGGAVRSRINAWFEGEYIHILFSPMRRLHSQNATRYTLHFPSPLISSSAHSPHSTPSCNRIVSGFFDSIWLYLSHLLPHNSLLLSRAQRRGNRPRGAFSVGH